MKWLEYVDFIKVSKALRCILQESVDNNNVDWNDYDLTDINKVSWTW